jgi:hypothetical protein
MISPSPIERHLDIVRAFGSRTRPLDDAVRRRALRRTRRREAAASARVQAPIAMRPAVVRDGAARVGG